MENTIESEKDRQVEFYKQKYINGNYDGLQIEWELELNDFQTNLFAGNISDIKRVV